MAPAAGSDRIDWVRPQMRGIIPLHAFHASRSLRRSIRRPGYRICVDRNFDATVVGCADRADTWINGEIRSAFNEMHDLQHAHSVEVYDAGDLVIGGLYGLSLGGAFFAESKFSRKTDASKIALSYLVARLKFGGYRLLDVQFLTPHLARMGASEVPLGMYLQLLEGAIASDGDFWKMPEFVHPPEVLQLITQTS